MILGQILSLQYVLAKTTTHTHAHTQYSDTSKAGQVHLAKMTLYTWYTITEEEKKRGRGGLLNILQFFLLFWQGRENSVDETPPPTPVLRCGTLALGRSGFNQDNSLGTHALDVVTLGSLCLSGGDQDPSKKLLSSHLWRGCGWLAPESRLDQQNHIVHIICIHSKTTSST